MTTTERNSGTIIIILLLACGLTLCHRLTEAKAGTFLAPPKNPAYGVQDGFLAISWEAVIGPTGYGLYISDSPNNPLEGTLDVGPLTELGPIDIHLLREGRTFFLTAIACNAEHESGKPPGIALKVAHAKVFFDTTTCRDYPAPGYVRAIHESGAEEVITFSGPCNWTCNLEMSLIRG